MGMVLVAAAGIAECVAVPEHGSPLGLPACYPVLRALVSQAWYRLRVAFPIEAPFSSPSHCVV